MKKKISLFLTVALILSLVLQYSLNEIKASGKEENKTTTAYDTAAVPTPIQKLVVTEITEEEYLACLSKEENKVFMTYDTVGTPVPDTPSQQYIQSATPTPVPDTPSQQYIQSATPTPVPNQLEKAVSYTPKVVTKYFTITSMGGDYVCAGKGAYTVWYYTDGKVHLYSREITLTDGDGNIDYGSIVNTDGTVSYTSGDNINKLFLIGGWEYHYLNFIVTETQANLDIVSQYN